MNFRQLFTALKFLLLICSASVFSALVPTDLIPSRMELNGGWSPLYFNVSKSLWVSNKFTVTSPVDFNLLYSDAFCPGKMVSIYVNGTFLTNSTQVPFNPVLCSPRIDLPAGTFAFSNIFSHANVSLPAGEHEIAVKVIQYDSRLPSGVMYMRAYFPILSSC